VTWQQGLLLGLAGLGAGTINTIVGSGSLITFPVLLAFGYSPVLANVTNNLGVFAGSISGVVGYRQELKGEVRRLLPLAVFSAIGGLSGAALLLVLPSAAFDTVVPVLIIVACVLVLSGPWLKRWSMRHYVGSEGGLTGRVALTAGTGLTGVYGGYFGAAQGVILLALLTFFLPGGLQRVNAYKNVFGATANGAAAVLFVSITPVAWPAAGLIAIGAVVGGQLGATIGRRLPPVIYRLIIVAIGAIAIVYFYLK